MIKILGMEIMSQHAEFCVLIFRWILPFALLFFCFWPLNFRKSFLIALVIFSIKAGGHWIANLIRGYDLLHPTQDSTLAAFFALGTLLVFGKKLLGPEKLDLILKKSLIAAPLIFSSSKMACLLSGCCTGKLCWSYKTLPTVAYFLDHGHTALAGLPLYPVQMFESIGAVFVAGVVRTAHSSRLRLKLLIVGMCALRLGCSRYRAELPVDSLVLYGVGLVGGILSLLNTFYIRLNFGKIFRSPIQILVAVVFLLSGCGVLPSAPGTDTILRSYPRGPSVTLHHSTRPADRPYNRNLVFVAVSDRQDHRRLVDPLLQSVYQGKYVPRFEELIWWVSAPLVRKIYDRTYRVNADRFDIVSLLHAVHLAESHQKPYDLALLTHGIPNHIVPSQGRPLISWAQIASLKRPDGTPLRYLRSVFLQNCYGTTLAQDFHKIGAKYVMAFRGLNANFYFYNVYLEQLSRFPQNVEVAFERSQPALNRRALNDPILMRLIQTINRQTPQEFIQNAKPPELTIRSDQNM